MWNGCDSDCERTQSESQPVESVDNAGLCADLFGMPELPNRKRYSSDLEIVRRVDEVRGFSC